MQTLADRYRLKFKCCQALPHLHIYFLSQAVRLKRIPIFKQPKTPVVSSYYYSNNVAYDTDDPPSLF